MAFVSIIHMEGKIIIYQTVEMKNERTKSFVIDINQFLMKSLENAIN